MKNKLFEIIIIKYIFNFEMILNKINYVLRDLYVIL